MEGVREPESESGMSWGRLTVILLTVAVVVEAVSVFLGGFVDSLLLYLPGVDKVLHFAAFFTICVVSDRLTRDVIGDPDRRRWVVAFASVLLAAGDELGQGLRANRDLDVLDFVASLCGLGFGLVWTLPPERRRLQVVGALSAAVVATAVAGVSFQTQRHLNAAVLHERAGDFVSARREYRLAYESGVRTANLLNELGWVEIESGVGDADAAVDFAEQALALRPTDPDIFDTYGWALHHAGRSAEALPYLERAYAEKPDMFCIHYHLGEVYLALGRPELARTHLLRQLERTDTREAGRAAEVLARMQPSPGSQH